MNLRIRRAPLKHFPIHCRTIRCLFWLPLQRVAADRALLAVWVSTVFLLYRRAPFFVLQGPGVIPLEPISLLCDGMASGTCAGWPCCLVSLCAMVLHLLCLLFAEVSHPEPRPFGVRQGFQGTQRVYVKPGSPAVPHLSGQGGMAGGFSG